MVKTTIAQLRLINQRIIQHQCSSAKQVVSWLGAVQAQDYMMAKWAIGCRLSEGTNQSIETAIKQGDIFRTHLLRPTWHFVAKEDIRWMLELSAPQLKKATATMNRKLELDEKVFSKINHLLIKLLEGGKQLTRQELVTAIHAAGIGTNSLRAAHILFQAEIEGIICNGAMRDRHFTYALLEERAPASINTLTREEALARLASRYFSSHGPATLQDFAWWSGLPKGDARLGLQLVQATLLSESVDGQTYWFPDGSADQNGNLSCLHLLPAFDEFMVSYKDRTACLSPTYRKTTITANGIFKPVIVVNGEVLGLWKLSTHKQK
ncbi:winged helix DNA-binding domain-containing protein, partial [Rhodocytophaga aerolata]